MNDNIAISHNHAQFPRVTRRIGDRRITVALPADAEACYEWWLPHLPERAHPPVHAGRNRWTVPIAHLQATEAALLSEFGGYAVTWESASPDNCTVQCVGGNPDRADECRCTCGGELHGSGTLPGRAKVLGDLVLGHRVTVREWSVGIPRTLAAVAA